ncbi:MAG: energy transducer TonB [Vicinamibacterales bacterium]|nr:energy transducer TonB [Vicinamibacterales bacterium]
MSDLRPNAPPETRFLFEQSQKRSVEALGVSLAIHAAFFGLAIWIALHPATRSSTPSLLHDTLNKDIVWLDMPGPGGGGGGGGNKSPDPPQIAKLEGKDKITVPVVKPPDLQNPNEKKPEENPIQNLNIPAETLSAANQVLAGAMEGIPTSDSLGLGTGGGAGTGSGTGIGSGRGSGLGEGWGGGTGGGAYRPGNGVDSPVPISQPKPQYTSQAMRAKIQGTVLLECIVTPDGTVGPVRVLRSLDPTFGLDQEAIKAARSWRFKPGMRKGEAVAVLVTIEMAFTLR